MMKAKKAMIQQSKHLIISGLSVFMLMQGTVWSCAEPPQALSVDYRPQCEPHQLIQNMCFNPNMDEAIAYMDTPEYKAAFQKVVDAAMAHLDTIEPSKNKVVLFDLDETIVDNRQYYLANKTFNQQTWNQWVVGDGVNKVYDPVFNLLKTAQERGFSVMFVTGRPAYLADETLGQLPGVQWNGGFLKPTGIRLSSTVFKTEIREALREMGYEIVLNIGDQPSDMDLPVNPEEGEFLLPNVMYYIP